MRSLAAHHTLPSDLFSVPSVQLPLHLVQGVEDDLVVTGVHILAMQQDGSDTRLHDLGDVLLLELGVTVNDDIVTLDTYYLAGVLINEVLGP